MYSGTIVLSCARIAAAVKQTEVPNLDVLPCGPTPPNPAELLHTERFSKLLAECTAAYDLVVLDSPPTSAVTDPAILGNLVDGVVLVVKAGRTTREAATYARRQLRDAKAKLLGVVVNDIDPHSRGGYGYYYYYRHYNRYGGYYGDSDGGKKGRKKSRKKSVDSTQA